MSRHTAALLSLLFLAPLPSGRADPLTQQQRGLEGRWEGAIVIVSAEEEIEVTVDLYRSRNGRIEGQVRLPLTAPSPSAMQSLSIHGAHLGFQVHDKDGVATAFDGDLRNGSTISGTMTERGKTLPFFLHHRTGPAPRSEAANGSVLPADALPAVFDHDLGCRRILLILSPARYSSRMTLSLVRRYVLDANTDPKLRLYVLWEVPPNILPAEAERIVRQTASIAPDVRATHFWSSNRKTLNLLRPSLDAHGAKPIANPCLLFSAEQRWGATPPVPDQVRLGPQPGSTSGPKSSARLNGVQFALDVMLRPAGRR